MQDQFRDKDNTRGKKGWDILKVCLLAHLPPLPL